MLLSIIIILAGLLIYCVPEIAQYARKYGYNETFNIWHTIISNVLSFMLIGIVCIGSFIVDLKDSPIIPVIKHHSSQTLIHIINNLKYLDERFFHIAIGKNINLNQAFPEYFTFSTADPETRKKMNQVVKLLINHQIIVRNTKHTQGDTLYLIWDINV